MRCASRSSSRSRPFHHASVRCCSSATSSDCQLTRRRRRSRRRPRRRTRRCSVLAPGLRSASRTDLRARSPGRRGTTTSRAVRRDVGGRGRRGFRGLARPGRRLGHATVARMVHRSRADLGLPLVGVATRRRSERLVPTTANGQPAFGITGRLGTEPDSRRSPSRSSMSMPRRSGRLQTSSSHGSSRHSLFRNGWRAVGDESPATRVRYGLGDVRSPANRARALPMTGSVVTSSPGFISIGVSDVDRSATFYERYLGGIRDTFDYGPGSAVFVGWPTYALSSQRPPRPDQPSATTIQLWWRASDAQALYERAAADGVPILVEPFDGPFGRTFAIADPDGYGSRSTSAINRCSGRPGADSAPPVPCWLWIQAGSDWPRRAVALLQAASIGRQRATQAGRDATGLAPRVPPHGAVRARPVSAGSPPRPLRHRPRPA